MLATGSCLSRVEATTSGTASSTRETMTAPPTPTTPPGSTTPTAQQASAPRQAADQRRPPVVAPGPLTEVQRDQVLRLVAAATGEDGVPPLSEHATLHLRYAATAPEQTAEAERDAGQVSPPGLDLVTTGAGQVTRYAPP